MKSPEYSRSTLLLLIVTAAICAACSSSPSGTHQPPSDFNAADMLPDEHVPDGIYHTMRRGETLWQISRNYQVQLSEVLRFNSGININDIGVGTRIFIPQPHYGAHDVLTPPEVQNTTTTGIGLNDTPQPPQDLGYVWPLKGTSLKSSHIVKDYSASNTNLTVKASRGTVVQAIRSGKVILATTHFPGRWIFIDHGEFWSIYGNLGSITVTSKSPVYQGQQIGSVGENTFHFEIRHRSNPYNPRKLIDR